MEKVTDIEKNFKYHRPTDAQIGFYDQLAEECAQLAKTIQLNCPVSRERAIAIKKLEEVAMWAFASIARHMDGYWMPDEATLQPRSS